MAFFLKLILSLLFGLFLFLPEMEGKNHPHDGLANLRIHTPEYVIGEQYAEIKLEALTSSGARDSSVNGKHEIYLDTNPVIIDFIDGIAFTVVEIKTTRTFLIKTGLEGNTYRFTIRYLHPVLSILPPLIAIVLALITKEVLISLFLSIFFGILTLKGFDFRNIIPSLFTVVDTYLLGTLNDTRHLSVIVFSFLIGGMVTSISQNGGMRGIANILSRFAHSPRSAQLMTFFLSCGIFYDTYSNILIVGNSMKPVTDQFKVSREKLAFIVHGTAASITAIAFLTTWIGAELGYISDAVTNLSVPEKTYILFLKSLQFSFYPVLMLFFIFFLILLKKDFGPMNLAEIETRNAGVIKENHERATEEVKVDIKMLEPEKAGKYKWLNALIPLVAFITTAFAGMLITGAKNIYDSVLVFQVQIPKYSFASIWHNLHLLHGEKTNIFHKLGILISHSDFYIPLLWSSFTGITIAILLSVVTKGIKVRNIMENLVHGFRIMLSPIIILVFAWALADVMNDLNTADYIASLISSRWIFPHLLPCIVFILAALLSFAAGSVWGTMAILYPLILPVSWTLSLNSGLTIDEATYILYMIISVIISGSVLGNHASPISDNTIVSSISSDCDHVAHSKTQVPYALTVAAVSLILLLISLLKFHWTINYLIGIAIVFLIVKYKGKTLE